MIRVKLDGEKEEALWNEVEEKGVTAVAEETGYIRQDIYNWRSRDLFLPLDFVREMVDTGVEDIEKFKGSGREKPSSIDPNFENLDELLTRINYSVVENSEGVPFYLTAERSLSRRFQQLLEQLGDISYSVYRMEDRFQVRYPKHVHEMIQEADYKEHRGAKIDEKGVVREEKIELGDKKIDAGNVQEEIYSEEKQFQIALIQEDSEKIASIIREKKVD